MSEYLKIFKSRTFQTALFGTIATIVTFKVTKDTGLAYFCGGMFMGKIVKDGSTDFVKANKGVTYDPVSGRDVRVSGQEENHGQTEGKG